MAPIKFTGGNWAEYEASVLREAKEKPKPKKIEIGPAKGPTPKSPAMKELEAKRGIETASAVETREPSRNIITSSFGRDVPQRTGGVTVRQEKRAEEDPASKRTAGLTARQLERMEEAEAITAYQTMSPTRAPTYRGDVVQGEEVMSYPRTTTTAPTTTAKEPLKVTAGKGLSERQKFEQQMAQSADEDFLDQDLYGDYGTGIVQSGAYKAAREKIQSQIDARTEITGETDEEAGRALLEKEVTITDEETGKTRVVSQNLAENIAYRKEIADQEVKDIQITSGSEDDADNKKDEINTEGQDLTDQGLTLIDGSEFIWDVTLKSQPIPLDFTGAQENYLKGKDAHTRLKNNILEAYANGSMFIIPGNADLGMDAIATRIDSRNDLMNAIRNTLQANGLLPDEAMKAARQSLKNWEASINKIESRHRDNSYFNENFVDDTAGTPPVIAGEDPLPEIPEDWTKTVTEPDSPWWETFDEEAADAIPKTASELAAEEGIPQSTVESDTADYFRELANYTPTTPWSPPLEGLKQTAGSSDPSDPFSWNPFRGEPRPGFDETKGISTYGMPENLNEAVYSTVWIAHQKAENLKGVIQVIDELGAPRWIDMTKKGNILGEFAEATTEQLSLLEHVERVQEGVDAIYDYDRQFRMTQGNARLEEYVMKEELAITTQHDVDMQSARTEADAMMLQQSHNQKMEQLKLELQDSREVMQLEQNFEQSKLEADYRFRGWIEENKLLQQRNMVELDAAMKKYDIDEASRQAQAQESLKMTELNLQKTQMQFDLFKSLTSDPQMMFFMSQGGILSMFEDILGGQGNLAQVTTNYTNRISGHPIFKGIGEAPNIQEMAKMRPREQQAAMWGTRALTGQSMEQVAAGTLGGAPWRMNTGMPTREIALS